MYPALVEEEKLSAELRFRTTPTLKAEWERVCAARKISQQDAINGLVEWFVGQDEVLQVLMLGQLDPSPDLAQLVTHRMVNKGDHHAVEKKDILMKFPQSKKRK